jgi:hypothetical protein
LSPKQKTRFGGSYSNRPLREEKAPLSGEVSDSVSLPDGLASAFRKRRLTMAAIGRARPVINWMAALQISRDLP